VLAYAADNWAKWAGQLPVDLVVEHVEEDNGLVSNRDIGVAEELDKELFDPSEGILVVANLSHEESPLHFF